MPYEIGGTAIKRLYGESFKSFNNATKTEELIQIQPAAIYPARGRGAEAIGLRVVHHHSQRGQVQAFLKVFRADIPQRQSRSEFLISRGLVGEHQWVFQGVPYGWLGRKQINGVEIIAHITKFIGLEFGGPAEDFATLKENDSWDAVTYADRRSFVSHLASAVDALERMQFTHGDVSPYNIMVGPGPQKRRVCCLCDFDSFIHPKVPMLPRIHNGQNIRTIGTPGYQYPELVARSERDLHNNDDGVYVESDRFALAVIACEMMVWNSMLGRRFARETLLDPSIIKARNLHNFPDDIKLLFPEGFRLLELAMSAGSCRDMPAPTDWLKTVGVRVQGILPAPFPSPPLVQILTRRGGTRRMIAKKLLTGLKAGDFADIDSTLRVLKFRRTADNKLNVSIDSAGIVLLRRGGKSVKLSDVDRKDVPIAPGDEIAIGEWELIFEASEPIVRPNKPAP